MDKRLIVGGALLFGLAGASPVEAQSAWQQKWYWGGQTGGIAWTNPITLKRQFAISAGGHWLITGKRSGLYFGIDQILYDIFDPAQGLVADATVPSGVRTVDFSQGRRISALVYAIPSGGFFQPMLGGGFAINQILNAVPQGPFATPSEQETALALTSEKTTRAYAVMSGGFQFRFLPRWALFANYQFFAGSTKFLIDSQQHVAVGGLRYALTTSHEDVTTQR